MRLFLFIKIIIVGIVVETNTKHELCFRVNRPITLLELYDQLYYLLLKKKLVVITNSTKELHDILSNDDEFIESYSAYLSNIDNSHLNSEERLFTRCSFDEYSCIRFNINFTHFIYSCVQDYGEGNPVAITEENGMNIVKYGDQFQMSRSCNGSIISRHTATIKLTNFTYPFISNVICCKGKGCVDFHLIPYWQKYHFGTKMNNRFDSTILLLQIPILYSTIASLVIIMISLNIYFKYQRSLIVKSLLKLQPDCLQSNIKNQFKNGSTQPEKEKLLKTTK